MPRLPINRSPSSEHCLLAEKTLTGSLHVVKTPTDFRFIELSFETNPHGQRSSQFSAAISPSQFEDVARMMMEADAQAAIRAFGVVMQSAAI
jgi:hypothetical protein